MRTKPVAVSRTLEASGTLDLSTTRVAAIFFAVRLCVVAIAVGLFCPQACLADALERIAPDRLKATHEAVALFAQDRKPVPISTGYEDYRAVIHVHSGLSHDSRATPEEVRKGAREVGARVVMFSEHPAAHYDYFTDGHRGLVDGVLFIPGAEQGGLLCYPMRSMKAVAAASPQERVDAAMRDVGGLTFLSHLEERMDWDLKGLTGTEIYNTHADFKDEVRMSRSLRNPLALLQLIPSIEKYPQEVFGALQDYPADYLKRWDELCRKQRLTGVAANDSHHNQGMRAVVDDVGKVRVEDALGKVIVTLDPKQMVALAPLVAGKKAGDELFHVDLDPYERSLKHVSTHLLMKELSEPAVRDALRNGRAYVAFDWLCDPSGFVFQVVAGGNTYPLGSEILWSEGIKFVTAAPLSGRIRLLRDGREVATAIGRSLEYAVPEPGNYRAEVWLNLPDEPKIWILSNPIYITAPRP